MVTPDDKKTLEKLHARLVDTLNGYGEALDRTDDPALRASVDGLASLRRQHSDELAQALAIEGLDPQTDGGWMTVVHETIMKARDLFGTLDRSATDEIISGETTILGLYDDTIAALPATATITGILTRQRGELQRLIARESDGTTG